MKNVKKLLSILVVLTLVLSLGATAFAAEGTAPADTGDANTVTIKDNGLNHQYKAYQIFSGTQRVGGGDELAAVEWGKDINGAGFLAALQGEGGIEAFASCKTAADVSEALSKITDDATLRKFGKLALANMNEGTGVEFTGSTKLADGYYVIQDVSELGEGDVRNDIILQVTADVEVTAKNEKPSSEKKVKDVNDTTGAGTGWQDSADHDIGDTVEYRLEADLHELGRYEDYYLSFVDNLTKGLTYDMGSAKVFLGDPDDGVADTDVTSYFNLGYQFNLAGGASKLTWTCNDIKQFTESADDVTIYILYTCTLNGDAVIGPDGNPNDMHIEYSRDPNSDEHGNTPTDKVIVFTYEFNADKVDPSGEALEGAGFTLLKKVASGGSKQTFHEGTSNEVSYDNVVVVGSYDVEDALTSFDFKGLDDGDYILVESTVPDGYNKADDIEFTITATHNEDSSDPKLLTFTASGDVTVNEGSASGTDVTGKIDIDVENNTGLELPETGGIGTTIFYVAGAVLVAAAVILLVTRKRMSGADK